MPDNDSEKIVGIVSGLYGKRAQVTALPPHATEDFALSGVKGQIEPGQIVEARLVKGYRGVSTAQFEKLIEAQNPVQLAIESLIRSHAVPKDWPAEVIGYKVPTQVTEANLTNREDLRDLPLVTIDGSDAKDFDDAVFCEGQANGWRLVVAIADVASYVLPDTPIDTEAKHRGTSVYLPNYVIPMLPEGLSNGICSLRPYEDRLVVVCDILFDGTGLVQSSTFYEAVMHSHARLTYSEVARFLNNGGLDGRRASIKKSISALAELCDAMQNQAELRGALTFEGMESIVSVERGFPVSVDRVERNKAHEMIEMAMVAANVEAARFIEKHAQNPLYRVHETPTEQEFFSVNRILSKKNVAVPKVVEHPRHLQGLLTAIRNRFKPSKVWESAVLMAMPQARYDSENRGHFGLALESYAHFTSPIRRYPDLLIHRQIKSILNKTEDEIPGTQELGTLGAEMSNYERRAVSLERGVSNWLKALLLEKNKVKQTSGTIMGVKPFGLFVDIDGYDLSGLVHVSKLGADYFEYFDGELIGDASQKCFSFGMSLRVCVEHVEPALGRVNLTLVTDEAEAPKSRRMRSMRRRRY